MAFKKGHTTWNKGKPFSIESRKKISNTRTARHIKPTYVFPKGHLPWNTGKTHPIETRKKISEKLKGKYGGNKHPMFGKHHIEEARRKIKEARKKQIIISGIDSPNYGKHHSNETRRKMSESHPRGEQHPNWNGGTSFEPYTIKWNETLKRSIRERDRYTCRLCGKQQGDKLFSIHHIDYCKKNCSPTNLITLCNPCHMRTNYNRKKWIDYFTQAILNG
jgi:hypothetical protein